MVTTVNGGRTASLLVPSAKRFGLSLRVYFEDSEFSHANKTCCFDGFDLDVLYPWLSQFAGTTRKDNKRAAEYTVFENARLNARRRNDRRRTALTAKAHFIFRKVLAVRHAVLTAPDEALIVWTDADVALRKPFDTDFMRFAMRYDVATIHRYRFSDILSRSCTTYAATDLNRELPETGFMTFTSSSAARAFVLAWAGFYVTDAAYSSSCLNDICVYHSLLTASSELYQPLATNNSIVKHKRGLLQRAAMALLPTQSLSEKYCGHRDNCTTPPSALMQAWLRAYITNNKKLLPYYNEAVPQRAELREGWFAICPEAFHRKGGEEENLLARYRINSNRAHLCPGDNRSHEERQRVSHFHLFDYIVHAKGGSHKKTLLRWKQAAEEIHDQPIAKTRRLETEGVLPSPAAAWKEMLVHPFSTRVNLTQFFQAARRTLCPLGIVFAVSSHLTPVFLYDALVEWKTPTMGFSTVDNKTLRICRLDPRSLEMQLRWFRSAACCRLDTSALHPHDIDAPEALALDFLTTRNSQHRWIDAEVLSCKKYSCLGNHSLFDSTMMCNDAFPRIGLKTSFSLWYQSQALTHLFRDESQSQLHSVWARLAEMRGDPVVTRKRRRYRRRVLGVSVSDGIAISAYANSIRKLVHLYFFDAIFILFDDKYKNEDIDGVTINIAGHLFPSNVTYHELRSNEETTGAMSQLLLLAHTDGLIGSSMNPAWRLVLALSNGFKGGNCLVPSLDVYYE